MPVLSVLFKYRLMSAIGIKKNRRECAKVLIFTGVTGVPPDPASTDGQSPLNIPIHLTRLRYRWPETARRYARPIGLLPQGLGGD